MPALEGDEKVKLEPEETIAERRKLNHRKKKKKKKKKKNKKKKKKKKKRNRIMNLDSKQTIN